ncbi:hypothetical protein BO83DRAFT_375259 [Aspergillus eucalypticola CBS 122712]|uniref:Uncharacterized protein n=1 Tax=Aspergillus eucalypticola (strain CBS 122712 / IBT 29274) TaxID=1448314 RepID=A0A317W3B6_ASPEC|nr:uncharacterized protein BO83DRAFT_375259 [Aspergillus eucalypticola CBS 122712]PWY81054.1 hypothetical protein BO83DRAFT_375259 [Aspergillus eucalypticola CBS 122712]
MIRSSFDWNSRFSDTSDLPPPRGCGRTAQRDAFICQSITRITESGTRTWKGGTRLAEELGSGLRKITPDETEEQLVITGCAFMAQGPPPPLFIVSQPSQGRNPLPNQTPSRSAVGQWEFPTMREGNGST